ncbi:sterol desaturase family protein [Pseudomonas sp. V98_8]|jgi:sterol desaturase/sphingolipid hydroxylase (fatty acid hydroxylase superfamily)|uniref:sterol desaturase family protein n=1 Tax=Pseudomonas sp. V98_8 TaxID=3044228 RepID=UPI00249ECCF3|nr:sterol desaturase family protein [Pseudomonas sp. V98_8]MDI3395719.1 sterol desaturase family protein [Pseudomonas sp. V98_8]
MDVLALIEQYLSRWVFTPVSNQFLGLFDLNGRLCVAFLFISYAVAYGLFRWRQARGLTHAHSFWQFIGGNRVHFHPSALLDYRYYFVRAILKVVLVVPIVGLVDPYVLRSGDYIRFFTQLWGARVQVEEHLVLTLLYGLGVFLLQDFIHYWAHRAYHSRYLWAFHKVHHSATVLVPATASRVHFLEKVVERLTDLVFISAFAGLFWYACGGEISRYTLFGVTYMVFILNALAANLRHSHVWLSFGPVVEHVLNSPAQHQVHHSDAPRHFNKNFGVNLSLWDWMFGTLYVTQTQPEPIRFGTCEADHGRYLTVYSLIITPFVETLGKIRLVRRSLAVSAQAGSSVRATARTASRAVAPAAGTGVGPAN